MDEEELRVLGVELLISCGEAPITWLAYLHQRSRGVSHPALLQLTEVSGCLAALVCTQSAADYSSFRLRASPHKAASFAWISVEDFFTSDEDRQSLLQRTQVRLFPHTHTGRLEVELVKSGE